MNNKDLKSLHRYENAKIDDLLDKAMKCEIKCYVHNGEEFIELTIGQVREFNSSYPGEVLIYLEEHQLIGSQKNDIKPGLSELQGFFEGEVANHRQGQNYSMFSSFRPKKSTVAPFIFPPSIMLNLRTVWVNQFQACPVAEDVETNIQEKGTDDFSEEELHFGFLKNCKDRDPLLVKIGVRKKLEDSTKSIGKIQDEIEREQVGQSDVKKGTLKSVVQEKKVKIYINMMLNNAVDLKKEDQNLTIAQICNILIETGLTPASSQSDALVIKNLTGLVMDKFKKSQILV